MQVTLSAGSVEVRELPWGAYKKLRTLVLSKLGPKLLPVVGDIFETWRSKAAPTASLLTPLIDLFEQELGELEREFLTACVPNVDLNDLPLSDVIALRKAANELNPLGKFEELEKNSLAAGLLKAVATRLPEAVPADGGSTPSPA